MIDYDEAMEWLRNNARESFDCTAQNMERLGLVEAAGNLQNARCFKGKGKTIGQVIVEDKQNTARLKAKSGTLSYMANGMCIAGLNFLDDGNLEICLIDAFAAKAYKMKIEHRANNFDTQLIEMKSPTTNLNKT